MSEAFNDWGYGESERDRVARCKAGAGRPQINEALLRELVDDCRWYHRLLVPRRTRERIVRRLMEARIAGL